MLGKSHCKNKPVSVTAMRYWSVSVGYLGMVPIWFPAGGGECLSLLGYVTGNAHQGPISSAPQISYSYFMSLDNQPSKAQELAGAMDCEVHVGGRPEAVGEPGTGITEQHCTGP